MEAIFFPRKDYDVEVCGHRLGKKMTYTDQTDVQNVQAGGINTFSAYMGLAKARDIKVGCFMLLSSPVEDTGGFIKTDYENGKLWLDAYSLAPNISTKITNGQTITQAEWNEAYLSYIYPNFKGFVGKKPVALSYSYGNVTFKDYVSQFLGGRNSAYEGNTDYGVGYGTPNNQSYSFSRFCSKTGTTRWYDYAKTQGNDFSGSLAQVSAKIDETLLNGGWLNNFTHWHNYWQDGNEQWAETYLNLLQTKNANGQIYFAGYGEAIAYLVYRQLITRAVMYSPVQNQTTQLIIRLQVDNTLGIDTDLLQVPISIKFSTSGTPLFGKTLTSNRNLISLGSGDYIVEIPYTGRFPYAIINEV